MTSDWLYEQERKDAVSCYDKLIARFGKTYVKGMSPAQVRKWCSWIREGSLAQRLVMSRIEELD